MKKIILIFAIVALFYMNNKVSEEIIIPNDAIRIRVIANSNSIEDQKTKKEVRKYLQEEISPLLQNAKTKEEVRKILSEHVDDFSITVEKSITDTPYQNNFQVNYGLNYFPQKQFKGITYDEGYYESLVVTLGTGKGDNWWCVLFPPLCLTETEEENMEDVEYRSFIKDVISHFFG